MLLDTATHAPADRILRLDVPRIGAPHLLERAREPGRGPGGARRRDGRSDEIRHHLAARRRGWVWASASVSAWAWARVSAPGWQSVAASALICPPASPSRRAVPGWRRRSSSCRRASPGRSMSAPSSAPGTRSHRRTGPPTVSPVASDAALAITARAGVGVASVDPAVDPSGPPKARPSSARATTSVPIASGARMSGRRPTVDGPALATTAPVDGPPAPATTAPARPHPPRRPSQRPGRPPARRPAGRPARSGRHSSGRCHPHRPSTSDRRRPRRSCNGRARPGRRWRPCRRTGRSAGRPAWVARPPAASDPARSARCLDVERARAGMGGSEGSGDHWTRGYRTTQPAPCGIQTADEDRSLGSGPRPATPRLTVGCRG